MKKVLCILLVILLITFTMSSCKDEDSSNEDRIFPIEIQVSYYLEKSHFYRIYENGKVEYLEHDGCEVNLYEMQPKGYDYIDFDKKSSEVGSLDNDKVVESIVLVNDIIKSNINYAASDTPLLHIYYNNKAYEICVVSKEQVYKKIDKLFELLNDNTSVELDRSIY